MSFAADQISTAVRAELAMPSFVTGRMDEHYVTRVAQLLGGEHLHVWTRPQPGAIILASNDYLCISGEAALLEAQARCLVASRAGMLMSPCSCRRAAPSTGWKRSWPPSWVPKTWC